MAYDPHTGFRAYSEPVGPPCPFRACGFTWEAGGYPLSARGQEIIAEHNGVGVGQLSRGARNAPNPYMLAWIEALGMAKAANRIVRDADGRWFTPSRLTGEPA